MFVIFACNMMNQLSKYLAVHFHFPIIRSIIAAVIVIVIGWAILTVLSVSQAPKIPDPILPIM